MKILTNVRRVTAAAFIAVMLLIVLVCATGITAGAKEYGKEQKVSIIPYAHLDPAWYWQSYETVQFTKEAFLNTINLHSTNPDYLFNESGALSLKWMQDYYPDLFEEIKKGVSEGFVALNSGWTECDNNLPSAEGMIRQYMYAQKYYEQTFNKRVKTAMAMDVYDLGFIMPQILKGTGYEFFIGWRSSTPFQGLYWWTGIDGNDTILASRQSPIYNCFNPKADVRRVADDMSEDLQIGLYTTGMGDAGGGLNQAKIDEIHYMQGSDKYPDVAFSSVGDFYESITDIQKNLIRNHQGGPLLNGWSCSGTYAQEAEMKTLNRSAEVGLDVTERASTIGDWLGAYAYPVESLTDSWEKIIMLYDHGLITGTLAEESCNDIYNDYIIANNLIDQTRLDSVSAIASRADTTGEGAALFIFNPISSVRDDVVETTVTFAEEVKGVKVVDQNGAEVPSQIVSLSGNTATILFETHDLPSLGFAVYHAIPTAAPVSYSTGLKITSQSGYAMENSMVSIKINPATGNVTSVYDKTQGREMLQAGKEIELRLFNDTGEAWNIYPEDLRAEHMNTVNRNPKITLIENGPVRVTLRVERSMRTSHSKTTSVYSQDIVMYSNSKRVDFNTTVDWHEHSTMLKVNFPTAGTSRFVTYDYSNCANEVGINNTSIAEVPGHFWADMTDKSGDFGLSVLNDSKYGWDMPNNKNFALTLLRSSQDQNSNADMGEHSFTYSVYPHAGDWREEDTPARANELNYELDTVQEASHEGNLGNTHSFVSVNRNNVVVSAMKLTEDSIDSYDAKDTDYDSEMVLRISETMGKSSTDVKIFFGFDIEAAWSANMLEDKAESVSVSGNTISATIGRYDIMTFIVKPRPQLYVLVRPEITQVDLSGLFNIRGAAATGEAVELGMGIKSAYPAEQFDSSLVCGNITYSLGSAEAGAKNFIQCMGQTVSLPNKKCKSVHILAAAAGDKMSHTDTVTVNYSDGTSETTEITVEDWNRRFTWTTEFPKGEIARTFTHYHYGGEDVIEARSNLFSYEVPVDTSKTITSVTLPDDQMIKVAGISLEGSSLIGAGAAAAANSFTAVNTLDAFELEQNVRPLSSVVYTGITHSMAADICIVCLLIAAAALAVTFVLRARARRKTGGSR